MVPRGREGWWEGLMQTYFVYRGVRGYPFEFAQDKHRFMEGLEYVNHPKRAEIEHRLEVIKFFDELGLDVTKKAFEVARSTVCGWKKRLKDGGGRLVALASKSRGPKRRRKRETSKEVVEFILRYRTEHPGVGKATIKPVLDEFCEENGLRTVSESTVGRVLSDLKKQGRIPTRTRFSLNGRAGRLIERPMKPYRLKARRNGFHPTKPGDLVQMDAVYVFDNGIKRYIIAAVDLTTRFAFALCYKTLSNLSAKDLLLKFLSLAPFDVRRVRTDNGSEFEHHFHRLLDELNIVHWFSYPRHPQSNAHVERFHRTLQEQFLNHCEQDPVHIQPFNRALVEWLLWYDTQRPHQSLGRLPPLRYLLRTFAKNHDQSNMWWTRTPG